MWPPIASPARSAGSRLTRSPSASCPSAERDSVSGTAWKVRRVGADGLGREADAVDRDRATDLDQRCGRRSLDLEAHAVVAAGHGDDRSDLAHDAREHALRLAAERVYGSRRYASTSRSSPTGRVEAWSSCRGDESPPRKCGPSPERVGAMKTSSLSTRPASRNAVASVGPPSSRIDCTPSDASAASSSSSDPERSSRAESGGSGPRPKASLRGCRVTGTSRASSRGASARTVPIPTATASSAARSSWTRRREASPVTQRVPGTVTRPSSGDRRLVDDERAPETLPGAPGLVLPSRLEAVVELDLDPGRAKPLEASGRLRVRVEAAGDDPGDSRGEDRVDARRRAAMVGAGLHRHEERRAAGSVACRSERHDLAVRAAVGLGDALADDVAAGDDDRPDGRVRIAHRPGGVDERERAVETHAAAARIRA